MAGMTYWDPAGERKRDVTTATPLPVRTSARNVSFRGLAATRRTPGTNTNEQQLFTIENQAGSPVLVAVRRLVVSMDPTAALTTFKPEVYASRPAALPADGTVLTKGKVDTGQASDAKVVLRAAIDDAGNATAITVTPGTRMWMTYATRLHTAVGEVISDDRDVLPDLCAEEPLILRAGESAAVSVFASVNTSNPTTNHWLVRCMWEEFTEG